MKIWSIYGVEKKIKNRICSSLGIIEMVCSLYRGGGVLGVVRALPCNQEIARFHARFQRTKVKLEQGKNRIQSVMLTFIKISSRLSEDSDKNVDAAPRTEKHSPRRRSYYNYNVIYMWRRARYICYAFLLYI